MTGPDDPGDWGFPEVDPAGPASTSLPPPEDPPEPAFDTGSDAWWRAQAQAQREAARTDPVVPPTSPEVPPPVVVEPPELVEPQVLLPEPPVVTPLDSAWEPPDLPELRQPDPVPVDVPPSADVEPVPEAPEPEVPQPEAPDVVAPPVTRALPPRATRPAPPAAPSTPPVAEEPAAVDVTDPHGFPPIPAAAPAAASYADDVPRTRTAAEPERVGPARALAGAALAVAGVALGIGALLLLGDDEPKGTPTVALPPATVAPSATTTPEPTQAPSATATVSPAAVVPTRPAPTSAAPAPVQKVVVAVLNNSRVSGLADRTADRLRAGGWPVGTVGNYSGGTIRTTTVYYAPGQQAAAQELARQYGVPRVLPRFSGLPTKGMTLVVTRDFA